MIVERVGWYKAIKLNHKYMYEIDVMELGVQKCLMLVLIGNYLNNFWLTMLHPKMQLKGPA